MAIRLHRIVGLLGLVTTFAFPMSFARAQTTSDPTFDLIRAAAAGGSAGSDPVVVRKALDEALADVVVSRLYGTPTLADDEQRAIASLSAASPGREQLVEKVARVSKGSNPFDENGDGLERALGMRCSVEQVANSDDPASSVEQRRRAEAALVAARSVSSTVLTADALTWLGLYAIQGGDVLVARRYLSEASSLADRTGGGYARLTVRRYLGLTYALDGDLSSALRETSIAEGILASHGLPRRELASIGPTLYTEMIDYAVRLGDRTTAERLAVRAVDLLVFVGAGKDAQAEALERVGQLRAQGAKDDVTDARLGAEAFAAAARLWIASGQADRGVVDFTTASVLLVENDNGKGARPLLEAALPYAKTASLRSGVEFWTGRAYVAEGSSGGADRAASYAKAIALFKSALARLDASRDERSVLRTTVGFWLGRAYLDAPTPDVRSATKALRRAFDASIQAKDANTAILCAEQVLRADPAHALANAKASYDRLVAGTTIDPIAAANALAAELQREAESAIAVAPPVIALYDRVDASLAATSPAKAAGAAAALVLRATAAGDRPLVRARSQGAFDRLVAAKDASTAEDLAAAVWNTWSIAGDLEAASTWRSRYEALAEEAYGKARAAKRADAALASAEGLLRAARERNDAEASNRWLGAVTSLRRDGAESLERSGKLGLALDAWRALAAVFVDGGAPSDAQRAFARAAELAMKIDDRKSRAEALAGRARAELDLGDPRAALATSHEAIALSATVPVDGPDVLPPVSSVSFRSPAIAALVVRSAALASLAKGVDTPERTRLEQLARAADALADELRRPD